MTRSLVNMNALSFDLGAAPANIRPNTETDLSSDKMHYAVCVQSNAAIRQKK